MAARAILFTVKISIIDAYKHIRGYYDGTSDAQVNQLIKDIQRLKKENKN